MGRSLLMSLLVLLSLGSQGASAGSGSILNLHRHYGHPLRGGYPVGGVYGGYGYGYGYPVPLGVVGPGYGYGPAYTYGFGGAGQFTPVYSVAMPSAAVTPLRTAPATTARTRRPDTAFAGETMTLGDRLFRAGNFTKAVERYEQSIKADPSKATPRVRLAQIAMVRGHYRDAANWLREADAVEPTYYLNAADIRGLYLEPGDFTRQLAKLESHLQSHPEDRDSWLVLGAEHYFSGRTRQAADIFLRLTDRQPEPMLSAFLSASRARSDEP